MLTKTEEKYSCRRIITNENIACRRCGKRMISGMLAYYNTNETEFICSVCFMELKECDEKKKG